MRVALVLLAIVIAGGCVAEPVDEISDLKEMRRPVIPSARMKAQGFAVMFTKYNPLGPEPQMTVRGFVCDVTSERPALVTLVATALDAGGDVVARDEQKVVIEESGDFRLVRFTFAELDPVRVARYSVDVEPY